MPTCYSSRVHPITLLRYADTRIVNIMEVYIELHKMMRRTILRRRKRCGDEEEDGITEKEEM